MDNISMHMHSTLISVLGFCNLYQLKRKSYTLKHWKTELDGSFWCGNDMDKVFNNLTIVHNLLALHLYEAFKPLIP